MLTDSDLWALAPHLILSYNFLWSLGIKFRLTGELLQDIFSEVTHFRRYATKLCLQKFGFRILLYHCNHSTEDKFEKDFNDLLCSLHIIHTVNQSINPLLA